MESNDRAVALVRVSEVGNRKEGVDLHSDVTQPPAGRWCARSRSAR